MHYRDGRKLAEYPVDRLQHISSCTSSNPRLVGQGAPHRHTARRFPATLGVGLVMLALALPSAMEGMQLAFGQLGNELVQVIRAL